MAPFIGLTAGAAFAVAARQSATKNHPPSGPSASSDSCPSLSNTEDLSVLSNLFRVESAAGLFLSNVSERGVCVRDAVKEGEVVLSIPITSCFRDDEPPRWFNGGEDDFDNDEHDYERYSPQSWTTRLAASILDIDLRCKVESGVDNDITMGRHLWKNMLPDNDILRASLPLHWGEEVLSASKSTALELAVDSAYFARATAALELAAEFRRALPEEDDVSDEEIQRRCHDALDIVQTRVCRVEREDEDTGVQWGPPLRLLAPVFDMINHGGVGSANSEFGIESESVGDLSTVRLVVRAIRSIESNEEVLIDYGESARPAWRCLTSYGFVPDDSSRSAANGDSPVENAAELWVDGVRFEVDSQSVPCELVEVAAAQALIDGSSLTDSEVESEASAGGLTPFVARAISKRATEAALNLITEPEMVAEEDYDNPAYVVSSSLAALLRWDQHNVLLEFAENLELFSRQQKKQET
mmetsp:Transcript_11312/g.25777  ORF Transcript_11312/g.25777 Transcript_11312/m.25777 type:complete len:470 (+) Transcript_11312:611-2020(+)